MVALLGALVVVDDSDPPPSLSLAGTGHPVVVLERVTWHQVDFYPPGGSLEIDLVLTS